MKRKIIITLVIVAAVYFIAKKTDWLKKSSAAAVNANNSKLFSGNVSLDELKEQRKNFINKQKSLEEITWASENPNGHAFLKKMEQIIGTESFLSLRNSISEDLQGYYDQYENGLGNEWFRTRGLTSTDSTSGLHFTGALSLFYAGQIEEEQFNQLQEEILDYSKKFEVRKEPVTFTNPWEGNTQNQAGGTRNNNQFTQAI